ncbi:hypothetical protein SBRY_11087 [Actinacidiphila bryophytorum]|uniref:Uncharacterized protein n=1 Tax=Actinacidiphila bryophytorum TaxID=1436133 RepID=A0A9W4GY29_9ACTN|nr:hypothetical protein SBRY_11087 [Actinacidiphila bryophytorum]
MRVQLLARRPRRLPARLARRGVDAGAQHRRAALRRQRGDPAGPDQDRGVALARAPAQPHHDAAAAVGGVAAPGPRLTRADR